MKSKKYDLAKTKQKERYFPLTDEWIFIEMWDHVLCEW